MMLNIDINKGKIENSLLYIVILRLSQIIQKNVRVLISSDQFDVRHHL